MVTNAPQPGTGGSLKLLAQASGWPALMVYVIEAIGIAPRARSRADLKRTVHVSTNLAVSVRRIAAWCELRIAGLLQSAASVLAVV